MYNDVEGSYWQLILSLVMSLHWSRNVKIIDKEAAEKKRRILVGHVVGFSLFSSRCYSQFKNAELILFQCIFLRENGFYIVSKSKYELYLKRYFTPHNLQQFKFSRM